MKLLKDRVLVEVFKETTASGIILPERDTVKNKGKVLFAGPNAFAKVGEMVLYHEHVGTEYEHEGKPCLFLHEQAEVISIL